MTSMESTLKAAKKILKKDEKGSIKIKHLVKAVLEKIGSSDGMNSNQIKDWIQGSDKFSVEGKVVSLNSSKKRKLDVDASETDADKKSKKKAAKKAKKDAKKQLETNNTETFSSSSESISVNEARKWRTEHKVVLKVTKDNDDNGEAASKELNSNEAYLPFNTFTSQKCRDSINDVLLKQCTEVNGFKTPSAIQAQCWPVLLNTDNDKRRDVVG